MKRCPRCKTKGIEIIAQWTLCKVCGYATYNGHLNLVMARDADQLPQAVQTDVRTFDLEHGKILTTSVGNDKHDTGLTPEAVVT